MYELVLVRLKAATELLFFTTNVPKSIDVSDTTVTALADSGVINTIADRINGVNIRKRKHTGNIFSKKGSLMIYRGSP